MSYDVTDYVNTLMHMYFTQLHMCHVNNIMVGYRLSQSMQFCKDKTLMCLEPKDRPEA